MNLRDIIITGNYLLEEVHVPELDKYVEEILKSTKKNQLDSIFKGHGGRVYNDPELKNLGMARPTAEFALEVGSKVGMVYLEFIDDEKFGLRYNLRFKVGENSYGGSFDELTGDVKKDINTMLKKIKKQSLAMVNTIKNYDGETILTATARKMMQMAKKVRRKYIDQLIKELSSQSDEKFKLREEYEKKDAFQYSIIGVGSPYYIVISMKEDGDIDYVIVKKGADTPKTLTPKKHMAIPVTLAKSILEVLK